MSDRDVNIILSTVHPAGGREYRIARASIDTYDMVLFKEPHATMTECDGCSSEHLPTCCPSNVDRKGMTRLFGGSEVFESREEALKSILKADDELPLFLVFDIAFPLMLVRAA